MAVRGAHVMEGGAVGQPVPTRLKPAIGFTKPIYYFKPPVLLRPLPPAPTGRHPTIRRAWRYLQASHATVGGILESQSIVRKHRMGSRGDPRGRMDEDERNLLRSAIVFSSSGIDAVCRRLLRDCLPALVSQQGSSARKAYEDWLRAKVEQSRRDSALAHALLDTDPTARLVELYVSARTKPSLQGSSDLDDVRTALGVPKKRLPQKQLEGLDPFFSARNSIIHDMDLADPTSKSQKRIHRSREDTVQLCDPVFTVLADLMYGVAAL